VKKNLSNKPSPNTKVSYQYVFLSLDCIALQWVSQHKVVLNSTPLNLFLYSALKGAFRKDSLQINSITLLKDGFN